jgi:heptaprenylglyceryl phosphate synthase
MLTYGLVNGKSNYYVAMRYNKKDSIYEKTIFNKNGNQISDWFDWIDAESLVEGKSDYYIAAISNKVAIFHRNGNQISDWFDWIDAEPLVEGKSDYYIAKISNKFAIFHRNGNQISDWFDNIYASGLIRGKAPYYMTVDTKEGVSYIHKLGTSNKIGPFKRVIETGFISNPTATEITVETLDGKKEKITKQEADKLFERKEVEDEQTR